MFCKGKCIDVIAALLVTDLLTNYFTKKWADLYRPINFTPAAIYGHMAGSLNWPDSEQGK